MRALIVAMALAWAVAGASQPVRLLIVDETETVEESLRILALARALRATEVFSVRALRALPAEPWEEEPFLFVLLFPARGPTSGSSPRRRSGTSPTPSPSSTPASWTGFGRRSGGAGGPGSGDDLYPFLLSLHLLRLGVLVGGP